jgi:glycosyltransferase involved in cell wall biosynthesis
VPLRVLFVVPSLEPGGAERVVVRLLTDLPRERVEPHLALVSRTGALLPQVPPDVALHDLGAGRVRYAARPLLRLAYRLRPRVVLSTLGYLNLALLALRPLFPRGVRVIVREANTVLAELATVRHPRIWKLGYRLLYPRAEAIVCPARAVVEDLATGFGAPRGRLHHIPNPIDAEAIRRQAESGSSPLDEGGVHLVAVGRLAPQKAFGRLLEAFRVVALERPEVHLWILGEGPERTVLETTARRLGISDRVHLPGFVDNPFAWLRRAALFVQSSKFEGLPNALLEALACGVPVVAVEEPGGTREILEEARGAVLVRGRLPEDLAAAIGRVLGGSPGESPLLPERFQPERVVAAYLELFETLAS